MITNLRISNFRMLDDFFVPTLGRVNLIVGKNNSGKSTVLEALRIFARQGHPSLLKEIVYSHDEHFSNTSSKDNEEHPLDLAYQNFFPKREYPTTDEEPIYIGTDDKSEFVKINHTYYVENIEETQDADGETVRRRRRDFVKKSDLSNVEFAEQGLVVTNSGSSRSGLIELSPENYALRRNTLFWDEVKEYPVSYIPTQFLSTDYLASLWDSVALTDNESVITQALQVIDDDVRGLAFVQSEIERIKRRPDRSSGSSSRIAIIRLENQSHPIPLNSMGDGMLRILQLILGLFPARNGFLLIDEFENGLHYSVQEDTWKLIFKLSKKLNIQVFATTHSWDCIEAFKNATLASPEYGVLFRVGKSVRNSSKGRVTPTVFKEDELAQLTQADVELR